MTLASLLKLLAMGGLGGPLIENDVGSSRSYLLPPANNLWIGKNARDIRSGDLCLDPKKEPLTRASRDSRLVSGRLPRVCYGHPLTGRTQRQLELLSRLLRSSFLDDVVKVCPHGGEIGSQSQRVRRFWWK